MVVTLELTIYIAVCFLSRLDSCTALASKSELPVYNLHSTFVIPRRAINKYRICLSPRIYLRLCDLRLEIISRPALLEPIQHALVVIEPKLPTNTT